jgi:uncharacterized membrane protein YoaK (UPF0700 family)
LACRLCTTGWKRPRAHELQASPLPLADPHTHGRVSAGAPEAANPHAPIRGQAVESCVLSFVAGFVDTCVFVGLFGLFTAHVTGNFVLIGAALVHSSGDVAAKLLALPVFVLAVALTVKASDALRRARRKRVPPLLFAEAVLLLFAVGLTVVFGRPLHPDDALALGAGMLAAAAMGLQNAMMRLELASLPSSTVMTVNVTQSAIDVVTMLSRRVDPATDAAKRAEASERFARMWPAMLSFTLGAACGAGGYALAGLMALAVPALLCIALAWNDRGR